MNDKKTVFFKTLAPEQDISLENDYKSNDIDFEVEIPIIVQKSESQTCMLKPGRKYPELLPDMRKEHFSKWKVSYLQEYLASRGINKSGNKEVLINNAYNTYKLGLEETVTDFVEEQNDVKRNHLKELIIGNVTLPDPYKLVDGWFDSPFNLLNTVYNDICSYLSKYDAGKAFKNGKSLLRSGHLTNIKTHIIDLNVRYCFVRCNCCPEQRLSNTDYDVWVCLQKTLVKLLAVAVIVLQGKQNPFF